MKNLGQNLKRFVSENKKAVIGGTIVVCGVITGVLVVKYLGSNGTEQIADTVEVVVEGAEEALEGIESVTVTTI